MTEMLQAIGVFLENEMDWSYLQVHEPDLLECKVESLHGEFTCYAWAREDSRQVAFFSVCPFFVPSPQRREMGELLLRINNELVVGGFDLLWSSGQVRFRTSLGLGEHPPESDLLREALQPNLFAMERFLPAIKAVLFAQATPEEALAALPEPRRR